MTKRILLVQPNYRVKRDSKIWGISPPMGLTYLAAVLEKNEIFVEILDANALNLDIQEICDYAMKQKANIVGVSILTPAHNFSIELASKLPKEMVSVAGGPHASNLPEELIDGGFDIVVRGEGEYPFLDIAKGKELGNILGISYRKDGEIIHNADSQEVDPNTIPYPARHLLISNGCDKPYFSEGTMYFPWTQVYSSRGCPWNCSYCNKSISGRAFRPRSAKNVLGEIEHVVEEYKVKEIDFSDDVFNLDINRAIEILDGIIRSKFKLHLRFSNGLRIDRINEELLKRMKRAGTDYIAYGIESGDQGVLDRIPKDITLDDIRKTVKITKKIGFEVTGFFMFGLLGDRLESMQKTIDFAKELDLDVALFNIAIPYPGTNMYDEIKKNGKFLFKDWAEFYHTSGKMVYTMNDTAVPDEVQMMYKKANREFYFRPGYVLKKVFRAIINGNLPLIYKGAKRVIYSQK